MENENISLTGYSYKANNPEFRELVKETQKRFTKKNLIWMIVFLGFTIAAGLTIYISNKYLDVNADSTAAAISVVVSFASIPIFGILFVINGIKTVLSASTSSKIPKMGSLDCVVTERKQWESRSTDEHGYETKKDNCSITLRSNEGKKFKVTGHQARVVLPYVDEGDKVRSHMGFTYPLELFDKSKGNICVFCGARNDVKNNTCEKCQKPMLI